MESRDALLIVTAERVKQLEDKKRRLLEEAHEVDLELQASRARHRQLLNEKAPISALPYEIISHIFILCRSEHSGRRIPLEITVSQVSSVWREISTNMPFLWNHVHIVLPAKTGNITFERKMSLLTLYLVRSAQVALSVRLQVTGTYAWTNIFDVCGDSLSRCNELSISVTNNLLPVETAIQKLHSVHMPKLERLSVNIGYYQHYPHQRTQFQSALPTIFTTGAPVLDFVRLSGVAGPLQPPLDNVTVLHIDGERMAELSLPQFRTLMQATPLLTCLTLAQITIAPEPPPSLQQVPMNLPHLRNLRISGVPDEDDNSIHLLLGQLPLARIETLFLQMASRLEPFQFPAVHTLTLSHCTFPREEADYTISAFPNVVHLNCDLFVVTPLIIVGFEGNLLEGRDTINPFWRRMKQLTIREMRSMHCSLLMDSIAVRQRGRAPLQVLALDRRSRQCLRSMEELNRLRQLIQVQDFDYFEPWPPDVGFECEDDDTFPA